MADFLKARVVGIAGARARVRGLPSALDQAMIDAVTDAAMIVRTDAIRAIQQPPKSGKEYKRGGVIHRASAPGEAPATDTGKLVSSGTIEVDKGRGKPTAWVRFVARYAMPLEFGTLKMRARPFLTPAVQRNKKRIQERFIAHAKKAFHKGRSGR